MASYHYRAVNQSGAAVAGTLVADTAAEARVQLRQKGLFPERVELSDAKGARFAEHLPGARARASMPVALFTRQSAVLLAAGVPLVQALDVLSQQTDHRGLSLALLETREAVKAGKPLAEALGRYPAFFDRTYVGMVTSGEVSGTLPRVFANLADYLERQRLLQARISSALIYPAILSVMIVGVLVFLSAYVVPQIAPLLRQQGRPLPFSAVLLFWVGDAVRGYGWIMLLAVIALAVAVAWLWRVPAGRQVMDRLILRLPLLGKAVRTSLVSRFSMSFASLLRAGVPAMDALETLAGTMPNAVFMSEIRRIRREVIDGKEISSGMSTSAVFPMVSYMVSVGEHSGSLAEVLEHVCKAAEFELEVTLRRFLAVLEPAIVLVMASVVGFIAISLVTTILELSHF